MAEDDRDDPVGDRRRRELRRSTVAGIGGVLLVALGLGLTALHVAGDVVPTILAICGVGSLLAGVVVGAIQIADTYRRSDSDFDR